MSDAHIVSPHATPRLQSTANRVSSVNPPSGAQTPITKRESAGTLSKKLVFRKCEPHVAQCTDRNALFAVSSSQKLAKRLGMMLRAKGLMRCVTKPSTSLGPHAVLTGDASGCSTLSESRAVRPQARRAWLGKSSSSYQTYREHFFAVLFS